MGWYSEEGTQQAKNDTYLLISVGIQVIHLQRDTVKPQTIIQQNAVIGTLVAAIGTLAVDGWAVVFGTNKTMFFTKTHIDLRDTYTKLLLLQ